jgi:hypothetical protein
LHHGKKYLTNDVVFNIDCVPYPLIFANSGATGKTVKRRTLNNGVPHPNRRALEALDVPDYLVSSASDNLSVDVGMIENRVLLTAVVSCGYILEAG